ncbi:hypothetical protein DFH28DRAFT_921342 [Melampsora americana]|nr:hypothetical protein DFH28DRAFT_921342 [Melampsora americana]
MSSDGGNYNEAVEVSTKLDELRDLYISNDGSNNMSIFDLRARFAKILPYSSRNWYRHWSEFAYELIRKDGLAKRPVFSNSGARPTLTPRSDSDRMYIFAPPTNPEYPPDLSRPASPANTGLPVQVSLGLPPASPTGVPMPIPSMEERVAALSKANVEAQNRINMLLDYQEKSASKKRGHHHSSSLRQKLF